MIKYTVSQGDTLTAIAARFHTTVAAIVEANKLANPDLIYVGQVLLIPVPSPGPGPCPPTPPHPTPPHGPCHPTSPDIAPPHGPCHPTSPDSTLPDGPSCPPTPPPGPPQIRPIVTRTFDGVEFTLSLNKSVYGIGEPIRIQLRKRNILRVPLTLTYRTSQRVDFRVTRDDRLVWQWSQGRVFTQAVITDRLQPGEEKVYREVWDQRADGLITRPGVYRITVWNLATPSIRLTLEFRIRA